MKERPILFSGAMVRAILEGRKTQTRRAMKPQPQLNPSEPGCHWVHASGVGMIDVEGFLCGDDPSVAGCFCPYGQPGDRLWVRETWGYVDQFFFRAAKPGGEIAYRADGGEQPALWGSSGTCWRPSIHMPRSACRLMLEITAVRVERLQAISEDDALAEGIDTEGDDYLNGEGWKAAGSAISPERYAFASLWRRINGDASWDANPWVWVVEFRRVEA